MSNKIKIFLILVAGIFLFGLAAFAGQPGSIKTEKYFDPTLGKYIDVVAGQILVKFKPSISSQSISALNSANNVRVITRLPNLGVYNLSGEKSVAELLAAYDPKTNPNVEYAEPNHLCVGLSTTPNDPSFNQQWGLTNIKAPQTWDIQKGSSSVIIAVVDSGVDLNHEDLKNRVIYGHDYVDGDEVPSDELGHGTHVAGIIGAQTNNSLGVAGVNWDCRLLIIRVLNSANYGTAANFAAGVNYAADHGAKVINLSLALDPPNVPNTTMNDAVQYAHGQGCVLVAAAGNNGDTSVCYPASCDNVISVAAVDQYDNRASYSNANAFVDVCAPGGMGTGGALHSPTRIYSTMPSYHVTKNGEGFYNNYDYMHGTSMAAPFVAGFAGLIFAQNPTWTNTSVKDLILSSVDHLGSGAAGTRNDIFGYGRINLYKAFNTTPPAPPTSPTSRQYGYQVILGWTASPTSNLEKYYVYRSLSAAGPFTLVGSTAATALSYTDTVTQSGTYYYSISAVDAAGLESALSGQTSLTVTFTLPAPPTSPTSRQNDHQVIVGWTASTQANIEKYYVYRSLAAAGPFTLIASTAATTLSYTDTVTQPGTYYYKISAMDALGLESPQTTATSIMVVFAIADINVYPNPLVITTGAALTFTSLSGNETIRIYTISGELVLSTTLTSGTTWNWNARNTANKLVARGVYLYLITRPNGEKRVGKVAVIG